MLLEACYRHRMESWSRHSVHSNNYGAVCCLKRTLFPYQAVPRRVAATAGGGEGRQTNGPQDLNGTFCPSSEPSADILWNEMSLLRISQPVFLLVLSSQLPSLSRTLWGHHLLMGMESENISLCNSHFPEMGLSTVKGGMQPQMPLEALPL